MDFSVCAQCKLEIEGKGVHYRNHVFCSDECCEEFDEELVKSGEPDLDGLEDDFDEDDLGYQEEEPESSDDLLDDYYEISPDDF